MPLLNVAGEQLPNDTAQDDKTKLSIEENATLGGQALKVVYAPGDAFGNKGVGPSNWKDFVAVEFSAFNPKEQPANLTFSVRHKRTTSFQTRVDVPVKLKPGKNRVRIGIDEMQNVNGSSPDLSSVTHWYLSCDNSAPTLFFGDIWLVGDDKPAVTSSGAVGGEVRLSGTYKIRGTIDGKPVDLTLTPDTAATATAAPARAEAKPKPPIATDPARVARIRAAKIPPITKPVMFDTPEADAILSALEVFPPDNAWNQVVTDWPLHPKTKDIVASIGAQKFFRYNPDMAFVIVPPDQKRIDVEMGEYSAESDKGPFPIPENMPIEGWPVSYHRDMNRGDQTLLDVQRDKLNLGGDRHALVVDPVNRMLYEFYAAKRTVDGWQVMQSSIFDLKSNKLRPQGWTSSDAAGLPIFPAVVRYDELKRGLVEHAIRVTVVKTRRAYVHPATHYASRLEDENLPRMGERLRLRRDFDVSGFSPEVQAILKGLKLYGMFVADNGIDWAISVAPDPRIPNLHDELRKIKGADFEVVVAPE